MARIRAIKPEFWSSPNLPEDPWARLLFIAMWNWADDNGVGTCNERELLGFAFPNDEHVTLDVFRRVLEGVRRAFEVEIYTVEGRKYYYIPSFAKHQKFDRRSRGKYPLPEQGETAELQAKVDAPPDTRRNPPHTRRENSAGTGEQGNRGTGEQRIKDSCAPAVAPTKSRQPIAPDRFQEFYDAYPRKRDRKKAHKAWTKAIKKTPPDVIIAAAARFRDDPNLPDAIHQPYPSTWLNGENWNDPPFEPKTPTPAQPSRINRVFLAEAQRIQSEKGNPDDNPRTITNAPHSSTPPQLELA